MTYFPSLSLAQKNDCQLFMFGSTSKKRPNNLVLGRLYENELLDMVELGINKFKSLHDFHNEKIGTNVKPCLVFNGPKWKQTDELRRLKSLLVDTFHREKVERIRLQGIEHVLSFTATEDLKIMMRSHKILLKKSGLKTPRIELAEIGPAIDFSIRRTKIASEELYKQASRQPKALKVVKKKNVSRDELGNKHGRVHVGKQNIQNLQTRKIKGLKKSKEEKKAERMKKKKEARTVNVTLDDWKIHLIGFLLKVYNFNLLLKFFNIPSKRWSNCYDFCSYIMSN